MTNFNGDDEKKKPTFRCSFSLDSDDADSGPQVSPNRSRLLRNLSSSSGVEAAAIGLFADSTAGDDLTFRTRPSVVVGFCSSSGTLKRFARWLSFSFSSKLLTVDETTSPNRSVLFLSAAIVSLEPTETAGVGTDATDAPNRAALAASLSFGSALVTCTTFGASVALDVATESDADPLDAASTVTAAVRDGTGAVTSTGAGAVAGVVATASPGTAGVTALAVSSEIESLRSAAELVMLESMPSTSASLAIKSDFLAEAGRLIPLSFNSFFNSVTYTSQRCKKEALIGMRTTRLPTFRLFNFAGSRDMVRVCRRPDTERRERTRRTLDPH